MAPGHRLLFLKGRVCGVPIPALDVEIEPRRRHRPITAPTHPGWGARNFTAESSG